MLTRFRSLRSIGLVFFVGALTIGAESCSDDGQSSSADLDDGGTDASSGAGHATGGGPDASAGSGGSAGATGGGGSAAGGSGAGGTGAGAVGPDATAGADAGFPGETVLPCPGVTLLDPSVLGFPACPLCADAICVPNSLLDSFGGASATNLLGDCDASSKCVPTSYVAATGNFRFKECRAFAGAAEGRCVNRCIPQVADQIGLEQDVCGDNELCAPCYMPTDGSSTGACSMGCDPGPTDTPYTFDACCGDLGMCVPESIVPVDFRTALTGDVCPGGGLCAPAVLVTSTPATCDSILGAEGRCIPACVGAVASQASFLPTAGCATGEVCAPCYNPGDGQSTGACSINGDAPTEPPVVFAECCSGTGRCVPSETIPANFRSVLTPDTCSGDGGTDGGSPMLCAPLSQITGVPNGEGPCSFPGAFGIPAGPGACYDPCAVPAFASIPQAECATGRVCLPCFLADGSASGACDPSTPRPGDAGPADGGP